MRFSVLYNGRWMIQNYPKNLRFVVWVPSTGQKMITFFLFLCCFHFWVLYTGRRMTQKHTKKMFFCHFFVLIWLGEMKNIQKHTVKTTCTKKWKIRILSARVAWENFEKITKITDFDSMSEISDGPDSKFLRQIVLFWSLSHVLNTCLVFDPPFRSLSVLNHHMLKNFFFSEKCCF